MQEYTRYLQRHPEGYQKLVSAFLIKVTEFFRDAALFEELKANILPKLIKDAFDNSGELRIWSAGASTGEEAYSIAMLCADLIRDEELQVRIFATDIDEDAIAFARRGIYGKDAVKDVPRDFLGRYFVRMGESFEVGKRIRHMTLFGQHDLAQRAPFPRIDMVVCRNVLIYFTKELQSRALQLFAFALRDKGFMVLGKAESTTPLSQYFQSTNSPLKIYQRVGERILIPPTRYKDVAQAVFEARAGVPSASTLARATGTLPRASEFRPTPTESVGRFVFSSPMGIVVVDRRYDIIALNPAARNMLQIHGVGVGDDLLHSAQAVDREALRELIDASFRGESPGNKNFVIGSDLDGRRMIKVLCLYDPAPSMQADGVALVLLDVTDEAAQHEKLEQLSADQGKEMADLKKRVTELTHRQRALLKANDDLTMANAELRTTNEQLLINAEEAASSHEEVETLNEEMQATNEELETLNEELQATVEELNTTNDELQARTAELERTSATSESRLAKLVQERNALAAALEARSELLAIFDENGQPVYVSVGLDGDPLLHDPAQWKPGKTVKLRDGQRVVISLDHLQMDGKKLRLVRLAPPPAQ